MLCSLDSPEVGNGPEVRGPLGRVKGPNMARGGVNSLFKNSTRLTRASG